MSQSYKKLKQITDKIYSELEQNGKILHYGNDIKKLLLEYKIKLRQKDGKLDQITISIPISKPKALVVGLRYIKIDRTKSEDLFLFEEGKDIVKGYKGKLEKLLPEYKNTHKLQR
jgi:hypothetical protein